MSRKDIFEKVLTAMDTAGLEIQKKEGDTTEDPKINLETDFVVDCGADSLDGVELSMEVEEVFCITIPDEDAEKFQKVGDVVEYVFNRLSTEEANVS